MTANGHRPPRRDQPLPRWFTLTTSAIIVGLIVALLAAGVVWVWQAILR